MILCLVLLLCYSIFHIQFTEEKIGTSEKTLYDAQFENLALRADRTKTLTEKLLRQGEATIQPNPGEYDILYDIRSFFCFCNKMKVLNSLFQRIVHLWLYCACMIYNFLFVVIGVRIEEFMYEKLDKKNPPRPTNAFLLGQIMQDASQDVGPGTGYGMYKTLFPLQLFNLLRIALTDQILHIPQQTNSALFYCNI